VLLVGHLDTVYPLGTVARRPFTVSDGRAYGPAVLDMKGGLAVMLFALRALAATRGVGNVRVVLNSDEEPGSPTSRDRWAAWGADVDWAFVLEPALSDGSLVLRRKGVGIFRLEVAGRAAHAGAEPERGANAILALAHHLLAAAALADPAIGTTVNVGVVRGGALPYVVPAAAEALIDVRAPTRGEAERVLSGLRALERAQPVPGTRLHVHGSFHRPPMEPVEGTEALAALVEACGREVGLAVRFASSGGASDGNNLAAAGVPTVDGMGPAGAGAHSEEEWVDIVSLVQKTQLLAIVLDRLWAGALPRRSRR
jgi:glutamate carboxypeptidase